MKTNYFFIFTFLSFIFCVSCSDSKKTSTTEEKRSEIKDTIAIQNNEKAQSEVASISPDHYICYTNDEKPSMQLSIAFDDKANALFVKYKGQKDSIPLKNVKEDFSNDGAYPTITQFYHEMYEGKKNGMYELTHSGNWDYAKYIREKDGKIFQFTINHDMTIVGDNYRTTPCFNDSE